MVNSLGNYDPTFYAQEALIQLENALGMASRVHRGYDEERRSFGKGSVISINRPSSFVVNDAPATAQDLDPDTVNITLSYWREVKFKLTDKELAMTTEKIIEDHIRPAAYALADDIDLAINSLLLDIPWYHDVGTIGTDDITAARQILFDNKVPMIEGMMHCEMNGALDAGFQNLSAFTQWQGSGPAGAEAQRRGQVGFRYGTEFFANQNTPDHTSGTASTASLLTVGVSSAGATQITLDAVSVTGTLAKGDSFVIAGNSQRYAVTATNTASGNTFTNVQITPALVQTYADNSAVTVNQHGAASTTKGRNCMFHRNAFAFASAPLSTLGRELGAMIETVQDPLTGLALRHRMYYVGNSSEVHVALDVLFGIKTLDPNLAVNMDL